MCSYRAARQLGPEFPGNGKAQAGLPHPHSILYVCPFVRVRSYSGWRAVIVERYGTASHDTLQMSH
jgi:hypothetical protein